MDGLIEFFVDVWIEDGDLLEGSGRGAAAVGRLVIHGPITQRDCRDPAN